MKISASHRFTSSLAAGAFAILALTVSAQAQGVARGAEEGFYEGGRVFGPPGALVGGAVGGVVGGVAGGVQGVLGIPQDTRTRAQRYNENRRVKVKRAQRRY